MSDLNIGLAGYGYWGSKLARNVNEAAGCRLAAIAEPHASRRADGLARFNGALEFDSVEQMVDDEQVDAVVLATPASTHAEQVRVALDAGKHVLVEKPLALSSADCDELCVRAGEKRLTLMVGHTFVYSEPVRLLRRLIESGELGRVLYVYAQRLNLGIVREDLNALWNFGPHDVSIMTHLLGSLPERVSALQYRLLNRSLEDVVFLVLEFPNGVVGHVHESWLDPRKVRLLTVVGDRKMAVYDDTDVEAPIRIYDKRVVREALEDPDGMLHDVPPEHDFGEFKLKVRSGDMLAPHVPPHEPLRLEIEHFVDSVVTGRRPLTDGEHARGVVAVLEAAERSARAAGEQTPVAQVAAIRQ